MSINSTHQKGFIPWRALFWEPVSGTGERMMVGVIYCFNDEWKTSRILRDDILDSLYGKSSSSAKNMIEFGLSLYLSTAKATNEIKFLDTPMAGLMPGPYRETVASSESDILRTAALMHSSLAKLDIFDAEEEFDSPQPEEVNRRFSTEIRENVTSKRPELHQWFNKGSPLITNGSIVKFGFCSPSALIHFSLLRPVTQSASVKDARAKLWELSRASDISGIKNAALITAMPNENDPTIGPKQLEQLLKYKKDIEDEADAVNMRLHAVYNVNEASDKLIEMAAA
ncbi:hypothetical protein [Oxalobacter formigenes]|uniref:DUF3037 domain-containing protein n=1 Tax=Oxalobacter formigenes OXCC13 TaxID=556269 RepID=C3X7V0_OXAFO|nr:hypothetical protein [Oxalobacter formigenes]ARQ46707.1 hypothetical protein BRW83_1968 [Oxalobacter formigenes]EEO29276.1 hypothetical protein OFBG_00304 [Oxalobacter formigenes OXCC13]MCZ4062624.1 hypothetical protein [Oxalobacter formigenes]QDX32649.1 hypothetical protein FPZ51_03115 [Oxalobacter formigenes]WAW07574.1 hypothetical protein NB638_08565 [Oxalobacter formigenes]